MKPTAKGLAVAALVYGGALLCLYTLDLFCTLDAATGFFTVGPAAVRYLLWLPGLALCALTGLYVPKKRPAALRVPMRGEAALWLPLAVCAAVYGGQTFRQLAAGQAQLPFARRLAQAPRLRAALLALYGIRAGAFLVLALFCALHLWECARGRILGRWMLPVGALGSLALCLEALHIFLTQASSLHRAAPVASLAGTLAALWFFLRLVRALYLPRTAFAAPLCRCGLLAFVFGTCAVGPQTVWCRLHPGGAFSAGPGLLTALVGALGALFALSAVRPAGKRAFAPGENGRAHKNSPTAGEG